MFEQVCILLHRWQKEGKPLFPISVNLSRRHFQNADFLQQFHRIVQQYQIPPNVLEMELTESIFFDDQSVENVKTQIEIMHQMGFLCSLDDFGSGFSSLGLLKEFDVDNIKLDRRFFLDIESEKARDIIESLIQLSQKLHIHSVAEGIETKEQLQFLQQIHCEMVQGYIYSKPLPVDEFEMWLEEQRHSNHPQ